MIVLRFILRFIVVPVGACFAAIIAVSVICIAHWSHFVQMVESNPDAASNLYFSIFVAGPLAALTLTVGAVSMMTPAAVGIVISEAFALRSWLFHTANGALASWIGWTAMQDMLRPFKLFDEPTISVAAGIAAGFAYWLVAGWSAGFWKPVFASPPPPPTVAPA